MTLMLHVQKFVRRYLRGWVGRGCRGGIMTFLLNLRCCSVVHLWAWALFLLDQDGSRYWYFFSVPLLDDTLNFVVQTCLISDRRWVDWGLIGHARGHVFRCWLQFCRGRNTNRVLTSALLVLSRRLLRSRAMPNGTVQPPSASQDGVTWLIVSQWTFRSLTIYTFSASVESAGGPQQRYILFRRPGSDTFLGQSLQVLCPDRGSQTVFDISSEAEIVKTQTPVMLQDLWPSAQGYRHLHCHSQVTPAFFCNYIYIYIDCVSWKCMGTPGI